MQERREFDGEERSVARARLFVSEVLAAWRVPVGDAPLLVSELATNAVVHAGSPFTVKVACTGEEVVRLEVSDTDPTPPVPRPAVTTEAVGGRGLLLVTALARQWGYRLTATGKTVWFEV